MAKQIKIMFGVNTLGDPWNIVLAVGPDLSSPTITGRGPTFKFKDPSHISGMAKARELKFCMSIEEWGPNEKLYKTRSYVLKGRSHDLFVNLESPSLPRISRMAKARQNFVVI